MSDPQKTISPKELEAEAIRAREEYIRDAGFEPAPWETLAPHIKDAWRQAVLTRREEANE